MNLYIFLICTFVAFSEVSFGYIRHYGPMYPRTYGEIWPKPKEQEISNKFISIRPSKFNFTVVGKTCDLLKDAITHYKYIIKVMSDVYEDLEKGELEEVKVNLAKDCEEWPYYEMDESYSLEVKPNDTKIQADSIWGMLRGLESMSQLMYVAPDRKSIRINETKVVDSPRYPHRGLLVDTSRHFVSMDNLKIILNGMAYNKLNVFHWHIVDDPAFPYNSTTFPELSAQGAYDQRFVYSQKDIAEIIEYARKRGIRTMAEFDTPGHTASWGASHPEILTACEGEYAGKMGPLDPTKPVTYEFLGKLFAELVKVFPDKYQHLGGDEVEFECWESNKAIREYMAKNNITTFNQLEEYYFQKVIDMFTGLGAKSIVWQEVFENGVKLPEGTLIHVWTGDRRALLDRITKAKLPALLSSCWYLDHLATGGDWEKYYECEPSDFTDNVEQQKLLIGGESCMWSELVDDTNIVQRIFPRVSAMAEKLWSPFNASDTWDALMRLEEHYCRMQNRGISAQPPNHAGYCILHEAPKTDEDKDKDGDGSGTRLDSPLVKFVAILMGLQWILRR